MARRAAILSIELLGKKERSHETGQHCQSECCCSKICRDSTRKHDWSRIGADLNNFGCAVIDKLLADDECLEIAGKHVVRLIGLSTHTWKQIEPILTASQRAQSETGRFKYYGYLVILYRTYIRWKHLGISKRMAREVANCAGLALLPQARPFPSK
jgi:hypothetical protein